jgi:hypothetical protein
MVGGKIDGLQEMIGCESEPVLLADVSRACKNNVGFLIRFRAIVRIGTDRWSVHHFQLDT